MKGQTCPCSTPPSGRARSTSTAGAPAAAGPLTPSNQPPARPWAATASPPWRTSARPPRPRPRHKRNGPPAIPEDRAAVLRRAGQLWEEHAAEIQDWIVRESGGIPPKAGLETHIAANECYDASALPSLPAGDVLTSNENRWSFARRRPVGVVSVIAPFNFPLILSIRAVAPALALGNAVLLKPDPRTAVCGGVTRDADLRGGRPPAGAALAAARRRGHRRRRRRSPRSPGDRLYRLDGGRPQDRRNRRPAAQARPPRTGRQQRADRAARRRPGQGGLRGGVRIVHAPGPDLHGGRPAHCARGHLRRLRRRPRREGRPPAGGRSEERHRGPRPGDRRTPAAPGGRDRPGRGAGRRPAGCRRHPRRPVLPAHRAGGPDSRTARRGRTKSSARWRR